MIDVTDTAPGSSPVKRRRGSGQRTTRLLHSWLSMAGLLVVLFFAATGLLANNPSWTFGQSPQVVRTEGQLPSSAVSGTPDFLAISEYLRAYAGATGQVTDYGLSGTSGRISYGGPGVTQTVTFDAGTGAYVMQSTRSGVVALLTDLHRGTNASVTWKVAIDVAAIGLAAIAVTGLVLQLMIARRRRSAMILLAIGVVLGVSLMFLA